MVKVVQNSQNVWSITQHSLSAALLFHWYQICYHCAFPELLVSVQPALVSGDHTVIPDMLPLLIPWTTGECSASTGLQWPYRDTWYATTDHSLNYWWVSSQHWSPVTIPWYLICYHWSFPELLVSVQPALVSGDYTVIPDMLPLLIPWTTGKCPASTGLRWLYRDTRYAATAHSLNYWWVFSQHGSPVTIPWYQICCHCLFPELLVSVQPALVSGDHTVIPDMLPLLIPWTTGECSASTGLRWLYRDTKYAATAYSLNYWWVFSQHWSLVTIPWYQICCHCLFPELLVSVQPALVSGDHTVNQICCHCLFPELLVSVQPALVSGDYTVIPDMQPLLIPWTTGKCPASTGLRWLYRDTRYAATAYSLNYWWVFSQHWSPVTIPWYLICYHWSFPELLVSVQPALVSGDHTMIPDMLPLIIPWTTGECSASTGLQWPYHDT